MFIYEKWPKSENRELEALSRVLNSGRWGGIFDDSENSLFEKELANYINTEYCITICNGTVALYSALIALGIKPGDEVIIPAYSFIATASAVTLCGGIPVFVDVDPSTLCMNHLTIEAAITEKTVAIIPVHLWGYMCEMDQILYIAKKHGLYVVEDCCQAIGATQAGKKAGSFGDIGIFSFAFNKSISCGEGGAIVTSNKDIYRKILRLRNHGRLHATTNQIDELGWNFRLSEFAAALLRCQLSNLDEIIEIKNANRQRIEQALKSVDWISPIANSTPTKPSPFGLVLLFNANSCNIPSSKVREMLKNTGIPVSTRHYLSLYQNPIYDPNTPNHYDSVNKCFAVPPDFLMIGQPVGYNVLASSEYGINYLIQQFLVINEEIKKGSTKKP